MINEDISCINLLLRLLIIQAICDNLYLTLSFIESIRTDIGWSTDFQVLMFVTTLYPLHNILLCLCIYMTVILSMERYLAVTKPIDYHMVIVSGRQWQRIFHYFLPILTFSIVFNLPKFFELMTKVNIVEESNGNITISVEEDTSVNITKVLKHFCTSVFS